MAAIERTFIGVADWRAVVGSLQLMRRILEEPPRTCRRCRLPWRLEHGVTFALHHRGLPLPKYCAACRAQRRAETESIYRRYAIVDESMQREAAARLDAWVQTPKPAASTGTVTTFRTGTGSERDQSGVSGVRSRRRDAARS